MTMNSLRNILRSPKTSQLRNLVNPRRFLSEGNSNNGCSQKYVSRNEYIILSSISTGILGGTIIYLLVENKELNEKYYCLYTEQHTIKGKISSVDSKLINLEVNMLTEPDVINIFHSQQDQLLEKIHKEYKVFLNEVIKVKYNKDQEEDETNILEPEKKEKNTVTLSSFVLPTLIACILLTPSPSS